MPGVERVLFVTSELTDLVKAGGLGEVSAYLPRVLRDGGVDTRIMIPGYRQVLQKIGTPHVVADLPALNGIPACKVALTHTSDGLPVYVVLAPELYDRPGTPYGDESAKDWADNDVRFARLALAAADFATGARNGAPASWCADVVHVNDWASALTPAYLAWRGQRVPSILTIHNLAYQGLFERNRMAVLGIPESAYTVDGVEFYGRMSFLKAGIVYASHLTTVSETYAREILTPEFGAGLDGVLKNRAAKNQITGILNGIDDSFDPSRDPHLEHHFDAGDFTGKEKTAASVREHFGLGKSGPLFSVISRLVHQKGLDLLEESADSIVRKGGQVVVIGEGDPAIEKSMRNLASKYPEHVAVRIGFDETLSRRAYAGADFLLMPSRFEPCGLSQQYAQRFGTLPIAHKTGGLMDTIKDGVTGFLFDRLSPEGLSEAVSRAFGAYGSRKNFVAMKRAAMERRNCWRAAAGRYRDVYQAASAGAGSGPSAFPYNVASAA
ncbi:MAG: glycogen synthase GlgA [Rhodospirillaceae bacterium]